MITITTEKLVYKGERFRKIVKVEGCLTEDELPIEYLSKGKYIKPCKDGEGIICFSEVDLRSGTRVSEEEFRKSVSEIKECGQRLHDINTRIKELEESWKGMEVIII